MDAAVVVAVALLGVALGAASVLVVQRSGRPVREQRRRTERDNAERAGIASVLAMLRSQPVMLDDDDRVVQAPGLAHSLGVVRQGRLVPEELQATVTEVRRHGGVRDLELTLPGPDNSPERALSARIGRLRGARVLVLLEDRTQERRIEAVRRDFVANVSHELKTPVGAIRLLSEAVQDAADDAEAVQRFAGRMHKESDRLGALVQQIIELSRLQGDDPLDAAGEVDVDGVLAGAIDDNALGAEAKQIEVAHGGDGGLWVLGSEDQIALAVSNLVANAITYSPEESRVAVVARERDDRVEISVTDQGIGIPTGEIDRIFERFYRVDPARHRSTGGTGLGLSIVKHVVASHGGDVRVWSREGAGSTFTLTLPRAPSPADPSQEDRP